MNWRLKLITLGRLLSEMEGGDGEGSSGTVDQGNPGEGSGDNKEAPGDEGDGGKEPPKRGATSFYKEQADKYKQEIAQMREQMGKLQQSIGEKEEQTLREQHKWQELAEKYKSDLEQTKNQFTDFKGQMVNYEKSNAVKQAALKAGIMQESLEDLELLDLEGVEIETTSTGRLLVNGAEDFVESLKERRPHWFRNTNKPNLNNDFSNDFKEKTYSMTDIIKLQKENPAEYKKQMQKILDKRRKAGLV